MARKSPPLSQVYRLIEPGPVVLLTALRKSQANVMTMSWHTMINFEPPIIGCVVSNRIFSFNILKLTKECVINIPTVELAVKIVGCGNTSGRDFDKFEMFHLTPVAASQVKPPLLTSAMPTSNAESSIPGWLPNTNFFVLRVIKAWIDRSRKRPRTIHHKGRGVFLVAGRTIKLVKKRRLRILHCDFATSTRSASHDIIFGAFLSSR